MDWNFAIDKLMSTNPRLAIRLLVLERQMKEGDRIEDAKSLIKSTTELVDFIMNENEEESLKKTNEMKKMAMTPLNSDINDKVWTVSCDFSNADSVNYTVPFNSFTTTQSVGGFLSTTQAIAPSSPPSKTKHSRDRDISDIE